VPIDRLGADESVTPGGVALVRARRGPPKRTEFDNADLRNRDFTGADLDGASFRQAQL
jgi:uncharacterized protein YjbI with pentapeptide repeats